MPRGVRCLAFIDLDGINALNLRHGYTEVDDRIRSTFSVPFHRSDVVARWYSGDEIVILFDSDRRGADMKIGQLITVGERDGLTFESAVGEWNVGQEEIETVLEAISKPVTGGEGEAQPQVAAVRGRRRYARFRLRSGTPNSLGASRTIPKRGALTGDSQPPTRRRCPASPNRRQRPARRLVGSPNRPG